MIGGWGGELYGSFRGFRWFPSWIPLPRKPAGPPLGPQGRFASLCDGPSGRPCPPSLCDPFRQACGQAGGLPRRYAPQGNRHFVPDLSTHTCVSRAVFAASRASNSAIRVKARSNSARVAISSSRSDTTNAASTSYEGCGTSSGTTGHYDPDTSTPDTARNPER